MYQTFVGHERFDGAPGGQGPTGMTMRIEFHDEDDRTRVVITQGPFLPEMGDMARAGWESSFTKLDARFSQ